MVTQLQELQNNWSYRGTEVTWLQKFQAYTSCKVTEVKQLQMLHKNISSAKRTHFTYKVWGAHITLKYKNLQFNIWNTVFHISLHKHCNKLEQNEIIDQFLNSQCLVEISILNKNQLVRVCTSWSTKQFLHPGFYSSFVLLGKNSNYCCVEQSTSMCLNL